MKSVLVDYRISKKSEDTLLGLGYEVIKSEGSANLAEPVCGHRGARRRRGGERGGTRFHGRVHTQFHPDMGSHRP